MRKFQASSILGVIVAMCLALLAQETQRGGDQDAHGAAAGARGGQRGGRRARGGRGGPPRGRGRAPNPPATGPVADATNAIIAAINNQDVAFLRTVLTEDAVLLDEGGHVGLPARVWAVNLTAAPRRLDISNLMVGDLGDSGAWAAFNYTLDETTALGEPNHMQGSSTIVYSKRGTSLRAVLVQLSVNGHAVAPR